MTTLDYISVRKTFPNTVALEGFDLNSLAAKCRRMGACWWPSVGQSAS